MADCVAGLDAGGTKTVCLISDYSGQSLGRGTGGPANANFVPEALALASLRQAMGEALAAAGATAQVAILAVTGPVPEGLVLRAASELLPGVALLRLDEGEAAVLAEQPRLDRQGGPRIAIAVNAGTGSLASGFVTRGSGGRRDEIINAGGWGALLGDEGSAYWIGVEAMRAAVRSLDGRGQATSLVPAIISTYGLSRLRDLVPRIYGGDLGRREIAALARVVAEQAHQGDEVAAAVLRGAAHELALMACALIRRLSLEQEEFGVLTFGSVFKAGAPLLEPFTAEVGAVAPRAQVIAARREPVLGCLAAALRHAGIQVEDELLRRLEQAR